MDLEISVGLEAFITCITLVWLDMCVHPGLVSNQQTVHLETLTTPVTIISGIYETLLTL